MPQNLAQLNMVILPAADAIHNTVCAVFVGNSKPTRETIGKLAPLIVRTSRLVALIEFLIRENPHYACSMEFYSFSK